MGNGNSTVGNDLSIVINHLAENEARWFAVMTKYKCEKYVVRHLHKKGVTAYIPLIEKVKRYSRKTKKYSVPLINCFTFVHIIKDEYVKVLETEYVFGFLRQRKDLICVPDEEIQIIKRVVGEVVEVKSDIREFQTGMPVEIIGGTLTGIRGKLVKQKGKNTFVVELQSIGYQLHMDIDRTLLKPVGIQQGT
ncbi:MAG TPA: UpxY family transcription antiterminator [Chitinophagaceae bacterium]|nr:UpxY family transcription antiterminator [Chitinophagaceae bacterium]